ncbi:MAG: signal recognition particle-docking protein FtsY, partial [Glaciimonas sp.]|nr:signal recognition particle-docking protein FtsY [Glaciimonas sp.]
AYPHQAKLTPKAVNAPPTNAPTPTQTGAPGPHARPAIAPAPMPPPIAAPVMMSSLPAALALLSAVAMV